MNRKELIALCRQETIEQIDARKRQFVDEVSVMECERDNDIRHIRESALRNENVLISLLEAER